MKTVFDYLMKLYRERKQITLLSWFYGTVAVVFVFFAGLCALVNQSFGVAILIVPLVAMVAVVIAQSGPSMITIITTKVS